MNLDSLADAIRAMTWPEIVAVVTGALCVWLTARRKVICWPIGIVSCALYVWLMAKANLYPDAVLNVYFIGMSVYGWYEWTHPAKDQPELPVTRAPSRALVIGGAIIALVTVALGWSLVHVLPSALPNVPPAAFPYVESAIFAMSLLAQAAQAKKWVEAWVLWIAIDVIAVPIYWMRQMHLTSLLYAGFLVLAWIGFVEWKRALAPSPATA